MKRQKFVTNDVKKKLFIEIYENSLGNVTKACKKAGISRKTFYNTINTDKKFAEKIWEADEARMDFGEAKLLEQMKHNDTQDIIFFCKTKARERGYGDKSEVKLTGSREEPIVVEEVLPDLDNLSNEQLRVLATIASGIKSNATD